MALDSPVSRFLTQLRADGRSQHTINQYARHLSLLGRWWGCERPGSDVDAIDHEGLASFLASNDALLRPDGQPKMATSMNALRSSLRGFFDYLTRSGMLTTNPARVVRMARTFSSVPQPLKPAETERLRATLATATTKAERRDLALFTFLLTTGARLSSALALRVGDLDLSAHEARLRELKGGGGLTVFLDADVVRILKHELGCRTEGHVFGNSAGSRLTARHAQRRFELWRDRAGLPKRYSPHSLRHTFASRLYERTGDILVVKEALGHQAITSTMVYAKAGPARVRRAVLG